MLDYVLQSIQDKTVQTVPERTTILSWMRAFEEGFHGGTGNSERKECAWDVFWTAPDKTYPLEYSQGKYVLRSQPLTKQKASSLDDLEKSAAEARHILSIDSTTPVHQKQIFTTKAR